MEIEGYIHEPSSGYGERTDFDSPWKSILERYFVDFMGFFFPEAHEDIDWRQGYDFLDKELQQVARDSELGTRYVDKLVKVFRKGGTESWVLIHVEVQGQADSAFAERMYVYNNRIFDRYARQVVSLAVLADDSESWHPRRYGYSLWGCRVLLEFPTIKLLDLRGNERLEERDNVFSVVVSAHLRALESRRNIDLRSAWKLKLVKELYHAGFDREQIVDLFAFVDWMMSLPKELEDEFWNDLRQFEENQDMRYMTSVERIGIRKGLEQGLERGLEFGRQQGIRDMILAVLTFRFQDVPEPISTNLRQVTAMESLEELHRSAMRASSLEEFAAILDAAR